jgi:DNA polymerase
MNLEQMESACASCQKCDLAKTRTNTVFYRGNPQSKLMIVGEAPGADEDESGKPFMGKAGQLLDKMFQAVSLDTNHDCYITNVVKCRPPGNRNPEPAELDECRPYLDQQIDLIKPTIIVAVGNFALQHFTGRTGITRLRGRWYDYQDSKVMPIYHPSYLLRNQHTRLEPNSLYRQAYRDLLAIYDAHKNNNFRSSHD